MYTIMCMNFNKINNLRIYIICHILMLVSSFCSYKLSISTPKKIVELFFRFLYTRIHICITFFCHTHV